MADDFTVPPGQMWSIDEALSVWLAEGTDLVNPPSINFVIYADTGSGAPGSPLYTRLALPLVPQVLDEEAEIFEYEIPLTGVPVLGPGRYWLSLQAQGSEATNGKWFWLDVPQDGAAAVLRGPGGEFETGCAVWTRRTKCVLEGGAEPDQSFILRGSAMTTPAAQPEIPVAAVRPKPKVKVAGSPKPGGGGTATLSVVVSGPGAVSVSGRGLKRVTARATRAGAVRLKLKLNGAGQKALAHAVNHKLKVKVTIAFTPRGGKKATSVTRQVTFSQSGGGRRFRLLLRSARLSRDLRRR
ncbi:MAG: hypothetical protein ACRDLL_13510 [Solirubrobacterales bacterium]